MSQNFVIKIPKESPFPYIAALLSFLSAGFYIATKQRINMPLFVKTLNIVFPILSLLLFSLLATLSSKFTPQIMIIPFCMVCLSFVGVTIKFIKFFDWLWTSTHDLMIMCYKILIIIVVLIFGILAFCGILKLGFIITCAISIILNITAYISHLTIKGIDPFSVISLNLIYIILFHFAFIFMALSIKKERLPILNI